MEQGNLYQTPESGLLEKDPNAYEFYVVSKKKFLILYFATIGMYPVYWFFKNWRLYSKKNDEKMWPIMRGIFSIFFTHSLFTLVDFRAQESDTSYAWNPSGMATIYVVASIVMSVVDRLSYNSIGSPYTDFVGLLLMPCIAWSLYKAQCAINIACGDSEGDMNSNLTALNYVWILLGSLLWLLIAIGYYDMLFGLPLDY